MKMKKVLAMALALVLAMAVGVGATLAYLTAQDSATNIFTVGNVKIDLTEPQWDAVGEEEAKEVYGGEALAKDPIVTNTGANPCFVRVSVEGLDCLKDAGMIQYRTNGALNTLGAGWVEYDGYYYYEGVLAAEKKTTALFDHIVIPVGVENGDGTEFKIVVKAYAVQAQGARPSFSAVQDMKAADIAAWFAVCAPEEWTK